MALVLALVLGVIDYRNIPVALLPRGFAVQSLWIQIPFPGGSPRECETEVAMPAEEMSAASSADN